MGQRPATVACHRAVCGNLSTDRPCGDAFSVLNRPAARRFDLLTPRNVRSHVSPSQRPGGPGALSRSAAAVCEQILRRHPNATTAVGTHYAKCDGCTEERTCLDGTGS